MQREVLPEAVRITVEVDREVPFYQERLENPTRLFFDLKETHTVQPLVDATFHYDSDVVREIRLGRHPDNTTRIVLDLEGVSRYSVFTLYEPYRIVIDCERAGAGPRRRRPISEEAARRRSARTARAGGAMRPPSTAAERSLSRGSLGSACRES